MAATSRVNIPLLPRVLMSALALAFLTAGIGAFVQHVSILRTWKAVEATVVRSEVIGFRNDKQREMFRGEVELAYSIGGQPYQTPDTFSHSSTRESSIRNSMETKYAVGTRHRVYFNPANPHALRWNVGWNTSFFLLPLAFTGVGLILAGVVWFLWRLPFPPRQQCVRCGYEGRIDDRYCPRCGDPLTGMVPPEPPEPAAVHRLAEGPADEGARDDAEDDEPVVPMVSQRRENPTALVLVGAFFGLPGVACLLAAAPLAMSTYAATHTWPTAEATVTRSDIETSRSRDGMPSFRLAIEFKYQGERNPQRATGRSIYVSASYPWIAERLARFRHGSRHTIRVNPRDPADVRFDTENTILTWLPTAGVGGFGLIFAAIGGALVRWGMKHRCTACRHTLRRGSAFCPVCGTSLMTNAGVATGPSMAGRLT